jgi:methionine-rich copper-binding protein CopC
MKKNLSRRRRETNRVVGTAARSVVEGLEPRTLFTALTIAQENALPGTPGTVWDINGSGDATIQGYGTSISINQGQTESFKINDTAKAPYTLDIYRMGWYQGNGARLISHFASTQTLDQVQPAPTVDPTTGLVDAGNWAVSASWTAPVDATSGIYFARVTRTDTGGASHIVFVVRNDSSHSNILFKTSDSTWEAYNSYGGNSLYTGNSTVAPGRAVEVSYNRPFNDRDPNVGTANWVFNAEYPMVRWLERNGYDVSYSTDVDTDRLGAAYIENHKVFMAVGHDEYWSGGERASVTAARDAGVNLAFFDGNEVFWKTRYVNSTVNTDGTDTNDRILVCYKDTHANAVIDPQDPTSWTGAWADPRFSPPADGGQPQNGLTGTLFEVNRGPDTTGTPMTIPASDALLRFWRNTSIAKLQSGQTATLGPQADILGYEWDEDVDNGFRPAGLIDMSSTTQQVPELFQDYGNTVDPGTATHSLTLYRASSGALVFGAGTVQWSWGLDDDHDVSTSVQDPNMQQATVNLLADMHVQPGTLQSGLVSASASTDSTAPTSVITAPTPTTTVTSGATITMVGTAVDAGGGVVAGVEVSTNGGQTWHPAVGRSSWSYSWIPGATGTVHLLSRAVDDSGNLEQPSAGVAVTVNRPSGPLSIFANSAVPTVTNDPDGTSVELGVRFRSDIGGYITGVRFYKGTTNTGTHVGNLWSSSGALLATATFTNETASGWQVVSFPTPVAIVAGATYIASYFTPVGHYSDTLGAFSGHGVDNGPLHALEDMAGSRDGLFAYAGSSTFPSNASPNSSNFFVDPLFSPTSSIKPTVTSETPPLGASGVPTLLSVTGTFNESIQGSTLSFTLMDASKNVIPATVTYDDTTHTATLTPTAQLSGSTTYTATISGAQDVAGTAMAAPVTWSFTTVPPGTAFYSLWTNTTVPTVPAATDGGSIEVGVKFRSDVNGSATGIRFYKGTGNGGSHIGNLWTSSGQLLATATFTAETASGWQAVSFSSPVAIQANTEYVVSYFAPLGHYAADGGYFSSTGVDSGPLHALSNAAGGGDGVYGYGASSAFPTNNFNSTNYWVDLVFSTNSIITPTVISETPASGASGVATNAAISVTFNESIQPSTISFALKDPSGNVIPTTLSSYVDTSHIATFTTGAALNSSTVYTASVSGAEDPSGNPMAAAVNWSFTTAASSTAFYTLWSSSTAPTTSSANDNGSIELGVKFRSDVSGFVTGIRFYKGAGNTGTHIGNLWTGTGQLMATATFANETASGWQEVDFANAVAVTANTVYVASYFAPLGHYAADAAYFATNGVDNGPLHALSNTAGAGDGVYGYSASSAFPAGTFNSTNYWVDVVFNAPSSKIAPVVSDHTPIAGATGVGVGTAVTATFNESIQPATLSFVVRDSSGTTVPATVSYDDTTHIATFAPINPMHGAGLYTVTISGATSSAGIAMAAPATWSFTTAATSSYTLWSVGAVPATTSFTDGASLELGVKFRSDANGVVTGIRFYKGAGNGGTHIGNLWSSTGQLLATATFTGESASGWQTVTFATPVSITANTQYVASYFAPVGHYSADAGYFANAGVDSGPLHALSNAAGGGDGLYVYAGSSAFPNNSYNSTNYWIDVQFTAVPPNVASHTPASGASNVPVGVPIAAVFSGSIVPSTLSFVLKDAGGNVVPATVAYDDTTHTATLTPTMPLNASTTYTATVSGAQDSSGNTLPAPVAWSFTTSAGSWVQSTVADFAGGTQSGTAITNTGGGEERLAQTSDDFTGTALSSAWTTTSWTSAGGAATSVVVSGSVVSISGAEVLSSASSAGAPIEASVNFAAAPFQHFGLATDFGTVSGNYWAMFSTGGTSDTLFARVNSNGTTQDVSLGALPTGFHTYRVQPVAGGFSFYIDGVFETTINIAFPVNTAVRAAFSSFGSGPLQVDLVRYGAYLSSGTFTSSTFDAGKTVSWGSVNWTATVPAGTTIQVLTSSSTDGVHWSTWSALSNGGAIASPAGRYLRYEVIFTTTNPSLTPILSDVAFSWT